MIYVYIKQEIGGTTLPILSDDLVSKVEWDFLVVL